MRALVLTGPGRAEVADVAPPVAAAGQVVVDVDRAGVCGTDRELFTGHLSYLHTGLSSYPLRPGHEWCGVVTGVGPGVDRAWHGRRVTGDTMIGCGHCHRCRQGRHHVCAQRYELGITDGLPGALAEQVAVPVVALHPLPATVDAVRGALVEPGGNALRCVEAAAVGPGERLLILGTGTIGLLTAMFARARGIEVHLLGVDEDHLALAVALGFANSWTRHTLPDRAWHGVVDASTGGRMPATALELVEPGRRIALIGLAESPSTVDGRDLVFKDVTAVGILGASAGLPGAVTAYADGSVDPSPLVGATVGLDEVPAVLTGEVAAGPQAGTATPGPQAGTATPGPQAGTAPRGPKIHVDPRLPKGSR
jgi:threonine dehydrogenase-like Zn-dependent dehydrogenase